MAVQTASGQSLRTVHLNSEGKETAPTNKFMPSSLQVGCDLTGRFSRLMTSPNLLNPASYLRFARERLFRWRPNLRGAIGIPPGHFHSPLLDIQSLRPQDTNVPFDGIEWWEHVDLRPVAQRSYYLDLVENFPLLPFPRQATDGYRYFLDNDWFSLADAFTLSGIVRKEQPRRIIEIGSGYSSAVILDTLDHTHASAALTFIEPNPERLDALVSTNGRLVPEIRVQPVQQVPLDIFDQLEANDVLFVDSSHVVKIGSDLSFIFLRVLPRLKPGVLIHFHDIFYPHSYPEGWLREGRAWNESLFLRALLVAGSHFEVVAFNSFAGYTFPELFRDRLPAFLADTGGSFWLRRAA